MCIQHLISNIISNSSISEQTNIWFPRILYKIYIIYNQTINTFFLLTDRQMFYLLVVFVCLQLCSTRLDYMCNMKNVYEMQELLTLSGFLGSPPVRFLVAFVVLIFLAFCVVLFVFVLYLMYLMLQMSLDCLFSFSLPLIYQLEI